MKGTIYYVNGNGLNSEKKPKYVDYFNDNDELVLLLMNLPEVVFKTSVCDLFVHWTDKESLVLNHFVSINSYMKDKGCEDIRIHFEDTEENENTMVLIFR